MKNFLGKLAATFILSLYNIMNLFLAFFSKVLFLRWNIPANVRSVIIFRKGNIGDIICAIPAIAAIRENFPQAKIILLSTPGPKNAPGAADILEAAPFLDKLLVYYKGEVKDKKTFRYLTKELKSEKADLFIELPQNQESLGRLMRDAVFARYIGVKYAFGFRIACLRLFGKIQSEYLHFDNEVIRLLRILEKERLKVSKPSFPLAISEKDKKVASSFLEGMDRSRLIALNPCAKRQTNTWPLERFAEIGKWLIAEFGATIVITGGEADKQRSERLKKRIGDPRVFIAAGKLTILQTIELLKNCRLLISNDTGAVHMASAVMVPVIGIYCAWQQRGKWYPFGTNNIVFRKEPQCHTCFKNECDHLTCLRMISVEEVKAAVIKTMEHSA